MFVESQDADRDAFVGKLGEEFPEVLPIRAGHDDAAQHTFGMAVTNVRHHIRVDVGVLGELGLGEHREPDIAQRLHPRPDGIGAVWGHIGEHGGFGGDPNPSVVG